MRIVLTLVVAVALAWASSTVANAAFSAITAALQP